VGTIVAGVLDAKIAATMTWRVGLAAAIYYENGCAWLSDRKTTYDRAKLLCGELSAKPSDRYDFSRLTRDLPETFALQTRLLLRYLDLALRWVGIADAVDLICQRQRMDPALIEATLREVRARRIDEGRPSAASQAGNIQYWTVSEREQARKFVEGLRAVGMATSDILGLGIAKGLNEALLEETLLLG